MVCIYSARVCSCVEINDNSAEQRWKQSSGVHLSASLFPPVVSGHSIAETCDAEHVCGSCVYVPVGWTHDSSRRMSQHLIEQQGCSRRPSPTCCLRSGVLVLFLCLSLYSVVVFISLSQSVTHRLFSQTTWGSLKEWTQIVCCHHKVKGFTGSGRGDQQDQSKPSKCSSDIKMSVRVEKQEPSKCFYSVKVIKIIIHELSVNVSDKTPLISTLNVSESKILKVQILEESSLIPELSLHHCSGFSLTTWRHAAIWWLQTDTEGGNHFRTQARGGVYKMGWDPHLGSSSCIETHLRAAEDNLCLGFDLICDTFWINTFK